ncbi:hypothetical protein A5707_02705, partial [Mycobacterium kyorinense]
MLSSGREEIDVVFDGLTAYLKRALDLCFDGLTTPERLVMLQRCETLRRQLPAVEHPLINQLAEQASEAELGGKLGFALAERLGITRADAARRIGEAADLGPRRAITGEPLEPLLPATAAALRAGTLGAGHVAVIRSFYHRLPDAVDVETRERAEAHLAQLAGEHRPDDLAKLAARLTDCLNPDGDYTDTDRARRRGLGLGNQHPDAMSQLTGCVSPELRAAIEAIWAKLAAPGMCNPEDPTPCVSGTPSQEAIDRDTRSTAQRHHDALLAAARALLASGQLGQHNGLPATIIVSTTLTELEAGTGK